MFCAEVVRASTSCCDKNDMVCHKGEGKNIDLNIAKEHRLAGMANLS